MRHREYRRVCAFVTSCFAVVNVGYGSGWIRDLKVLAGPADVSIGFSASATSRAMAFTCRRVHWLRVKTCT